LPVSLVRLLTGVRPRVLQRVDTVVALLLALAGDQHVRVVAALERLGRLRGVIAAGDRRQRQRQEGEQEAEIRVFRHGLVVC